MGIIIAILVCKLTIAIVATTVVDKTLMLLLLLLLVNVAKTISTL